VQGMCWCMYSRAAPKERQALVGTAAEANA
jgi:hypothetical protein